MKELSNWLRVTLLLIILALCAALIFIPKNKTPGNKQLVLLPQPVAINAMRLTDQSEHGFTEQQFKDHWSLVFFGFTNCGMVCPTTLAALDDMYKLIQQTQLPLPQVVFISIDPLRDSSERIRNYLKYFNPNFIGLHGSEEETARVMQQYKILVTRIEAENNKSHYTLDHTSEILVLNPAGKLIAYMTYPHQGKELASNYVWLLKHA